MMQPTDSRRPNPPIGYACECTLTPQTLLQADELFLTNAVRGIEWVASYKTKRYFHSMAEKLTAWIQEDLTSA